MLCLCLKVIRTQRLPDLNTHALLIISIVYRSLDPHIYYWRNTKDLYGLEQQRSWAMHAFGCVLTFPLETILLMHKQGRFQKLRKWLWSGIVWDRHYDSRSLWSFETIWKMFQIQTQIKASHSFSALRLSRHAFQRHTYSWSVFFFNCTLTALMVHIFVLYPSDAWNSTSQRYQ